VGPTVFVITQARTVHDHVPNLLAIDSVRIGYPDSKVIVVDTASCKTVQEALEDGSEWLDYDFVTTDAATYSDALEQIVRSHAKSTNPIAIVSSTVRFWSRCDRWTVDGLIAGRHIPSHINEQGDVVLSHLHHSHLLIPRPDALSREIRKLQHEAPDINLFAPHTPYTGGQWERYEIAGRLVEALGVKAQALTDEQLEAFDFLPYGQNFREIPDKASPLRRAELVDLYWRVRANPAELQGAWRHEQDYYEMRAIQRAA
jgi:hypothetical protein